MIDRYAASFCVFLCLGAAACERKSSPTVSSPVPAAAPAPAAAVAPAPAVKAPVPAGSALLAPEKATATAPALFQVKFATTKGDFLVQVHRDWAPHGADRFYNLVKIGFYDDVAFFRVGRGFMAQAGIHGDPAVAAVWNEARIPDDHPVVSNNRGTVCFAMAGPNTRTTQIFISTGNNWFLDMQGFSAFGLVVDGMPVVDQLYSDYGINGPPQGNAPDGARLQKEGNAYVKANYPDLDYIKSARIVDNP